MEGFLPLRWVLLGVSADWQSHLEVQGADSKGYKITWINFHPNPTSCPLNVLSYVQPPLHCIRWRRRLGSIGCLEGDSSEDDVAEQTDDEDAAEARKLAAADGDGEFRLMLESAVTEVAEGPLRAAWRWSRSPTPPTLPPLPPQSCCRCSMSPKF